MYKLIEKIPENIPENKIEKVYINYTPAENTYCVLRISMALYHCLSRFGLAEGSELYPISKDPEIKHICDLYLTDSFGLIPKKWIDKNKELYFYDTKLKIYFHLIVGEYKENL